MSSTIIATLAIVLLSASPPNSSSAHDLPIVVFRFLPGLISPNREARQQDHRQIMKMLEDLKFSRREESSGSGIEMSLSKSDLPRWKAAIDKMIQTGVLQYYRWGTDMRGYGLVPIK